MNDDFNSDNSVNEEAMLEPIGIPQLDILLKPLDDSNPSTHIVILKNKTPEIQRFVDGYKNKASKEGKVIFNLFDKYPDSELDEDKYFDTFEEIRIMRPEEYSLGILGWLPELPIQDTSYIAQQAHPMLFQAASAYYKEKGKSSQSIDITPTNIIITSWMRTCIDILKKMSRVYETRKPNLIYYNGEVKKLGIYFSFFLSRMLSNVLIEVGANTNIDQLLSDLPQYIKVDVI